MHIFNKEIEKVLKRMSKVFWSRTMKRMNKRTISLIDPNPIIIYY